MKSSNLSFDQIDLIVHAFIVRLHYYNIHMLYTAFEYDLSYIVFRHIPFFLGIIYITTYMLLF